jgi:hypothetical protein
VQRLLDALISAVGRMHMTELAQVIERDPRSARRWIQVLTGDRRLADLSVVAVLHLARHETRVYGSTGIADAFHHDLDTPEPPSELVPEDLRNYVSSKARSDIAESELVLEVQRVLADGRIDPDEADALRRMVAIALREATAELRQLELMRDKLG